MIQLSVIIVNYNVRPLLEQALSSIQKAVKDISCEIFVVDNNSSDGSDVMIRKNFPEVNLISNNKNFGFSKANNQALKLAKGKYICLVNPDTIVQADTFTVSLEFLNNHDDVGALGCKIINPDGTLQLACRRSFPTPWVAFSKISGLSKLFPQSKLFGQYNLSYCDPDEIMEVDAISGSFMMVRKKTIDEVGFLDESFFLFGEDLDWCYRIKEKGWRIIYLPTTKIIHYKGSSTKEAVFDSIKLFYQAMQIFVNKHSKKGFSVIPNWILLMGIWLRGGMSFLTKLFKMISVPLIDLLFIQISLLLSIIIKFNDLQAWYSYALINCIYSTVWLISFFSTGLYTRRFKNFFKALEGVTAGFLINASITFFLPQYAFSRQVFIVAAIFNSIFIPGWRILLFLATSSSENRFFNFISSYMFQKRVLIVGTDSLARTIMRRINERSTQKYNVIGFITPQKNDLLESSIAEKPVLGSLDDLKRLVIAHKINEIIFSPETIANKNLLNIIVDMKKLNIDFKILPESDEMIIGSTDIENFDEIPLVKLDYKIYRLSNLMLKRAVDLLVSFIFFPLLIPFFLYILLSRRYSINRLVVSNGIGGKEKILVLFKHGKRVLNNLGLVTLLLEVMSGKLTLVGTPIIFFDSNVKEFGFKPGITGIIQLYKDKSLEEKLRLHEFYLRNYSFKLDVEILIKSILKL
ncbi:MAG: glycosyltransferase [bacterium]